MFVYLSTYILDLSEKDVKLQLSVHQICQSFLILRARANKRVSYFGRFVCKNQLFCSYAVVINLL